MINNKETAIEFVKKVVAALRDAGFEATGNYCALGGIVDVSFRVSLDKKETWVNGIFENSRYSIFTYIPTDGKLLQNSCYKVSKFRKTTIKDESQVLEKILVWAKSHPVA